MKTIRLSRITVADVRMMSNVPWRVAPDAVTVEPDPHPSCRDRFADIGCPFRPTRDAEALATVERSITTGMRRSIRSADAILRAAGDHHLTETAIRRSALGLSGRRSSSDPGRPAPLAVERPYAEPRRIRERASFRDPESSPRPWSAIVLIAIKAKEHGSRLRRGDRQLDGLVPTRYSRMHFVFG